jgi:hypothetical protein
VKDKLILGQLKKLVYHLLKAVKQIKKQAELKVDTLKASYKAKHSNT